jgi:hypothetical protein
MIYEGLIESKLSVAAQDHSDVAYLPARDRGNVLVEAGEVYFHNQCGVGESTGSYFTKPFAVDHPITHSVDQILGDYLHRMRGLQGESLVPKQRSGRAPVADESTKRLLNEAVKERPAATIAERISFLESITEMRMSYSPSGECRRAWDGA